MNFKKIIIISLIIFSIFPLKNIFAQTNNVGIIPSNIWYSKDPFEEGDKIKIYTVVYNSDPKELSGSVIFFDNNVFLGKGDFMVSGKSTTDVSIDWTATSGDHDIFAEIQNAKFLISAGKYQDVYLAENKTTESKITVAKKEVATLPNISNISSTITDQITNIASSASDITQSIKNNTPPILVNTMNSTSNVLEKLRTSVGSSLETSKINVQKEIESLNSNEIPQNSSSESSNKIKTATIKQNDPKNFDKTGILKPLKYVELFFLTIFSFLFKYKILFYGLIILILFFIIRFIWHLIF